MPIIALLLAATPAAAPPPPTTLPTCRATQVRLSVDGRNGDFDGMSHSGVELSLRNAGADCQLPGLPAIELRDARGRLLPASRQAPIGMHPGPVVLPVRLAAGHRIATDIRWVSGPVFPKSHSIRAASIGVRIGATLIRTPLKAVLFGPVGKPVQFEQPPLRATEGMASG